MVLLAVVLVALSLRREAPEVFVATADGIATPPDSTGFRVLTIDASHPDRWRFISLSEGRVLERPGPLDWDLAVRRFHMIVNGGPSFPGNGGAIDLGPVPIERARPPADGYVATSPDSVNPAIDRWYRYGFTTHLLTPLGNAYAIRTATGATGLLEVLGYYCPGPTPGCFTIRYRVDNASN